MEPINHKPALKTYWYPFPNFGDQLTPPILAHFGIHTEFAQVDKAEAICIGSILQRLPTVYSGWVIGAGLIRGDQGAALPNAKILALRGKLTKARAIGPAPKWLGDLGLLANLLLTSKPIRQPCVGLIPHYVDKDNPMILSLASRYPNEIRLIDVQATPLRVISEIASCECVLSSSLHGIIVADSLGVPNVWLVVSHKVNGWGFKFFDYFSAFDVFRPPEELLLETALTALVSRAQNTSERIDEVRSGLVDCMSTLKAAL